MKFKATSYPCVVFYENTKKKHHGKPDRRFVLRYRYNGRRFEEGLGEGFNAVQASEVMATLKKNQRLGKGPKTLKEMRELDQIEQKAKEKEKAKAKLDAITFAEIFTDHYYPIAKADKDPQSYKREFSLFKKWINPVLGALPLQKISPIDLERIKKNMRDADLSDRSIEYALATARQIFNFSIRHDFFSGENPVKKVKIPRSDNKRLRFLTSDEAKKLLNALKKEAPEMWEQSLISLHTGLRASEIFRLIWTDINFEQGTLTAKDGKNVKTRFAYMTQAVKNMLRRKRPGKPSDLIYPAPDGAERREISRSFERIVKELGLNDGIEDRRDRVVFHSLRHSYASWLVQSGESLYVVKDRLGHSTISMTERYSHLSPSNAQGTVETIENFLRTPKKAEVLPFKNVT